jgi:hypothetical protein
MQSIILLLHSSATIYEKHSFNHLDNYIDTPSSILRNQHCLMWIYFRFSHTNKTSLLNAIDNLPYPNGGTYIVPALNLLTSTVYTIAQGDRPDISDTAIIITDGQPSESISDVTDAIRKVHDNDIRTLVVGVTTNINNETLRLLSSPPQKVIISVLSFVSCMMRWLDFC